MKNKEEEKKKEINGDKIEEKQKGEEEERWEEGLLENFLEQ